jgi:Type ISP C-terminal specificity domain
MTSLLTGVLGSGASATVTAHIPDRHHFRGSFGGKDVVPLWRNAVATEPNVTGGLLDLITRELGLPVSPDDLFAYAYAVLASPGYVERFSEELTIPGPHIPLTRDRALFTEASQIGRRLIWLHTYGTRFVPDGERPSVVPQGGARAIVAVPDTADYPERFSYDEASQTIHVGKGAFGPVAPEVWSFSVSGFEVVRSWLAYRMKEGAGRRSSPLDEIRPERWTPAFTEEFLELLWVLEATVAMYPALESLLGRVVAGPTFAAVELPSPTEAERAAPSAPSESDEQPMLGLQ